MGMALKLFLLFAMSLALCAGQRPSFAGSRPIGFPDVYNRTTTAAVGLDDRFGEGDATTQRLPIEANGDRDLIDRLSKLPLDKQPFWFINWQALEANRNNPQTYPQKPNVFVDPIPNPGPSSSGTNTPAIRVPNLNTSSSNTESPNQLVNKSSNAGPGGTSDSKLGIKSRFAETENQDSSYVSNENVSQDRIGSNTSVTAVTDRLLTRHDNLKPPYKFRPRNPIID